jgi:uncharacterized protein (DUF488 family)
MPGSGIGAARSVVMNARDSIPGRTTLSEVNSDTESRVLTLGYQGHDLQEVLQTVRRHGIGEVIDVRQNASSKKPGFASSELKLALAGIGVVYTHLPDLGCERASRHELWQGGSRESFLNDYRKRLATQPQAFAELVQRARSGRVLLLCLERDPSRCHRSVLVEKLHAEGILAENL